MNDFHVLSFSLSLSLLEPISMKLKISAFCWSIDVIKVLHTAQISHNLIRITGAKPGLDERRERSPRGGCEALAGVLGPTLANFDNLSTADAFAKCQKL